MKGIILAGGSGTRLYPLTIAVSKQLIPVYDKPMIYYPLSTLMLAGIREILIITTPKDQAAFQNLLGDGSDLGCRFEYTVQENPNGLAEAFILGEEFIGDDKVALVLGDNIFYGSGLSQMLQDLNKVSGGSIFAYPVRDPERYGVVEFDADKKAISIEEKPKKPKSQYAIPGLYFFDNRVVAFAKAVQPSARGELEITSIHNSYLKLGELSVSVMSRGMTWFDTGTIDSLDEATDFVRAIEHRQRFKIGCIEEVAFLMQFIDKDQLAKLAEKYAKSAYGEYLKSLL
ncbi:MAG: glucose-1-phosphate thymidylyltransferase [Cytophagaceae bacterium]|nr:glucose-1-phosphate thymidylyltransferase [Cytophagaceae bacterium]|tara:strand:- start:4594 stop:5451 length:858 start_codon:yes stop_codon:yes gene_type:complete